MRYSDWPISDWADRQTTPWKRARNRFGSSLVHARGAYSGVTAWSRGGRRMAHRCRPWALLSALLAALMVLVGCAGPEYTYVTNSSDRTYLKVPNSWRPIDPKAIDAALGLDTTVKDSERGLWLAGLRRRRRPVARPPLRRLGARRPATLIGVQDVPTSARGSYSLDKLRDLFYPVSPASQQQAAADPTSMVQRPQRDERRGAHARATACAASTPCSATASRAARRR